MGAQAQMQTLDADSRSALHVTLYQQGFAFVRDVRRLPPVSGELSLRISDLSSGLEPHTLQIDSPLQVRERVFRLPTGSPRAILRQHLGRSVEVFHRDPASGREQVGSATLLSLGDDSALLGFPDHMEVVPLGGDWRFRLSPAAEGLVVSPALDIRAAGESGEAAELTLAYLSSGLGWQMDYQMVLPEGQDQALLQGWASLRNDTGGAMQGARVQLIAGQVNRAVRPPRNPRMLAAAAMDESVLPESFAGYQMYRLTEPVDLEPGASRQIRLYMIEDLPVQRRHLLRLAHPDRAAFREPAMHPQLVLHFDNLLPAAPLPAGVVRAYQNDSKGQMHFVGEQSMAHIPVGGAVELALGEAFDVTVDRRQLAFTQVSERVRESAWELEVSNAASRAVTLDLEMSFSGDWEILEENHPHEARDARRALWRLEVPAQGRTRLNYGVRVR